MSRKRNRAAIRKVKRLEHAVTFPKKDAAYWKSLGACRAHRNQRPCAEPDWKSKCEVCGDLPVVCETGLCGPCTFGEAETHGGNW